MQGAYYQETMGMKGPISPSHAAPYSVFNGNSRAFATNRSSVQRLH